MDMFVNKLKRDPTSVELFDLAQSNSEHSRHWFFKVNCIEISYHCSTHIKTNKKYFYDYVFFPQGKLLLDGQEIDESLIDMVASTQKTSNDNNVIKFGDNSRYVVCLLDISSHRESRDIESIAFSLQCHQRFQTYKTAAKECPGCISGC